MSDPAKLLPRVAITIGDPAGIGPEIVLRAVAAAEVAAQCRPLVIGSRAVLARVAGKLGLPLPPEIEDQALDPETFVPGEVSPVAGAAAVRAVKRAAELALRGEVGAIATAPLNKAAMAAAGFSYPGHTELLAELAGVRDYAMLLAAGALRVIHVSTHVSLAEAIRRVQRPRIETVIRIAHETLGRMGLPRPRIAVAGLNPHAGEGGLFGTEEGDVIAPAIAAARAAGFDASGPWPGDTVFFRCARGDFDVVVAQYHDQGHIAVKQAGFETGVNITAGLPFFRVSVDHGTAFDLAWQGRASAQSMIEAILLAAKLAGQSRA
ncbi:MAG: 4-hydroxythreonine-4-phosphate dehydrogenase PdxA [Opitutia bacterium Tous-C1TDCM]|nr:MAG: 4-hydroxythreonine-4-phosphate dehydrogenase PdxA [Opitutae bacterium Tous-C1TDCM]